MQGAKLAPGSGSTTLALAYEEFNDMKCSRYEQNYQEAPPRYFYSTASASPGRLSNAKWVRFTFSAQRAVMPTSDSSCSSTRGTT